MAAGHLTRRIYTHVHAATRLPLEFNTSLRCSKNGMILTYTAFNIPLAVWLMYSFIRDLPPQMMEAAEVDGASRLRIFWRIVLPLTKGGLMVAMLFVFIFAWNEFQFALVLTDFSASTLPKALAGLTFSLITGPDWGIIGALASLMVVPVVVAAALIHKHIYNQHSIFIIQRFIIIPPHLISFFLYKSLP